MNPILFSSDSDEWQTPSEVYDYLHTLYDFTLDAAASHSNHKCSNYYTLADDALLQDWNGRVFLNPPYSKGKQGDFLHKAIAELKHNPKCELVVALIPARTDTKCWHEVVFEYASEIIFIKGRLKFQNPSGTSRGSATFPSCVVVFKHFADTTFAKPIDFKSWDIGSAPRRLYKP